VRDARAVIAVCLATHAPDPALLDRQLASLEAQAGVEWSLVRVDDDAGAGAWSAFERCYARVPAGAAHVAPCDQDDVWHPGKLAALRAAMSPGVTLAFCDQRIVDRNGAVLSPTYWTDRTGACDDLALELATNVVTGSACLVRRDVLEVALPFPAELDGSFHDHWLACCALALGEVAYVDRALVDYVQHGANVVGWSRQRARDERSSGAPQRVRAARDRERHLERPRLWARTLLERAGARMAPDKRQAAQRVARGALPWLVAGAVREQLDSRRTLEARRRALRGALLSGRG
jgi:glycosyltransferase involved in cell wall biosynthesis